MLAIFLTFFFFDCLIVLPAKFFLLFFVYGADSLGIGSVMLKDPRARQTTYMTVNIF